MTLLFSCLAMPGSTGTRSGEPGCFFVDVPKLGGVYFSQHVGSVHVKCKAPVLKVTEKSFFHVVGIGMAGDENIRKLFEGMKDVAVVQRTPAELSAIGPKDLNFFCEEDRLTSIITCPSPCHRKAVPSCGYPSSEYPSLPFTGKEGLH